MVPSKTNSLKVLSELLPRQQLYTREFWIVLGIFAVLYGLFLSRMVAPYQRTERPPQWDQAAWITPATDSAVAYYRREWAIDSMPTRAYIQVAAPDSFTVYVNGQKAGAVKKRSSTAFDIMDVGNYLLPGRNVIAVRVERETVPGAARLLVNLRWQDNTGSHQNLPSSEKWRVAQREERQSGGLLFWYERGFDDGAWAQAQLVKGRASKAVNPVHPWAGPELFRNLPRGAWISSGRPAKGGISYFRQFNLGSIGRGDIRSAWLGVASTGSYAVTINGTHGPTLEPSSQYMDTYDIGSYLSAGVNTIEINASNFGGTGRLAVSAVVNTSREFMDLSSNEDWRIRGYGAESEPVTVMGGLSSFPYSEDKTGRVFLAPTLRLAEVWLPGGLLLRQAVTALPWVLGVFLVTLVFTVQRFARAGTCTHDMVAASLLPWKLTSLALCVVFLLPFDVRISEAHVFNVPVALVIAALAVTLFSLIMSEIDHERP